MFEFGGQITASLAYMAPTAAKSRALNASASLLVSASIVALSSLAIDIPWLLW
jgi:hypothetical protein